MLYWQGVVDGVGGLALLSATSMFVLRYAFSSFIIIRTTYLSGGCTTFEANIAVSSLITS